VSLRSWFQWVHDFPSAEAIRSSLNYPYYLTFHAVTMAMFAGLIVMMDLRLLNIAFRQTPLSQIQKRLFPWQMLMMVASSISGLVLFYGQPMRYYGKVFFWTKMAMMLLAGVNALVFHVTTYRSVAEWDTSSTTPSGAKLAGAFSLALWAGVIVFGRITAYDWLTYK
jgi:hypothetical protein